MSIEMLGKAVDAAIAQEREAGKRVVHHPLFEKGKQLANSLLVEFKLVMQVSGSERILFLNVDQTMTVSYPGSAHFAECVTKVRQAIQEFSDSPGKEPYSTMIIR